MKTKHLGLFSSSILSLLLMIPFDADGLLQYDGTLYADVTLGQTKTITWVLQSTEDQDTTIQIVAEGNGSEFLAFPPSVKIAPGKDVFIPVTITIPDQYDGESPLRPTVIATKFDESSSSATINLQLAKTIVISVSGMEYPNPKEQNSPQSLDSHIGNTAGNIDDQSSGGGCLVATAAYGTELAYPVQQLRELRDNTFLKASFGSEFVDNFNAFYYSFSPHVADMQRQSPIFKDLVKTSITPLVYSLSILNHIHTDSEYEIVFWMASIISINVGLYLVLPITLLWQIKQRM